MALWAAAIGAATTVAGGIISATSGGGDRGGGGYAASQAALQRAAGAYKGLDPPKLADLRVRLERAVVVGKLTPMHAVVMLQQASEMHGVDMDPRIEFQQYRALDQLSRSVEAEGSTPEDIIHLHHTLAGQDVTIQGDRGAYMQSLAERGKLDPQARALESSVAEQAAANRGAAATTQAAADAEARMHAATMARAELARGMHSQAYGLEKQQALSQDEINRANTAIQNQQALDRAAEINRAREYNITQRQATSDINTQIASGQRMQGQQARLQDYQNRLAKARGLAGTYSTGSAIAGQRAADAERRRTSRAGAVLGTVGSLASAGSRFF